MYEQYLFPLNEMYYGKHPYFKALEDLFDKFRDFSKRHELIVEKFQRYAEIFKNQQNSNVLHAHTNFLFESNRGSEIREYNNMIDSFMSNLNRRYFDKKNMEDFYERTFGKTGLEQWHMEEPFAIQLSKIQNKNQINPKLLGNVINSTEFFIPLTRQEAIEYDNLTNLICSIITKIFNLPNLDLIFMVNSQLAGAACLNNTIIEELRLFDLGKDKSITFKEWINKQRLNRVTSDNMSIKFKDFEKGRKTFIAINEKLLEMKSNVIVGILLHEIGHAFGFKLLPPDLVTNMIVQERFADAFAAKFGYGMELIIGLNNIAINLSALIVKGNYQLTKYRYSDEYGDPKIDLTDPKQAEIGVIISILKDLENRLVLQRLKPRMSIINGPTYNQHPSNKHRAGDILSNLIVELNNPRLSPLKKRELKNDIQKIKTLKIDVSDPSVAGHYKIYTDMDYKAATSKWEIENTNTHINSNIIRKLLDDIYDRCMKNANS